MAGGLASSSRPPSAQRILQVIAPAQVAARAPFEIVLRCRIAPGGPPLHAGCAIRTPGGALVFAAASAHAPHAAPLAAGEQTIRLVIGDNRLLAGRYQVDAYLLADEGATVVERAPATAVFDVPMGPMQEGVCLLDHVWLLGGAEPAARRGPTGIGLHRFECPELRAGGSWSDSAPASPDALFEARLAASGGPVTCAIELSGRTLLELTLTAGEERHVALPLRAAFADPDNPFLAPACLAPAPDHTPRTLAFRFTVAGPPGAAGRFDQARLALPGLTLDPQDTAPFDRMQVESAEPCDAHCSLCFRDYYAAGFKGPILSAEHWRRLLPHLPGLAQIDLGGWGEPTLNRRLPEMIADCRDAGIPYIIFSTHANRIDHTLAEALVAAGPTHVNISIDGATEETVAALRAGTSLAGALAGIERLRDARLRQGAAGPRLQGSYVLRTGNLEELPQFVRRVAAAGADEIVLRNAIAFRPEEFAEVQHTGFYPVQVDTVRRDAVLDEARSEAARLGLPFLIIGPLHVARRFSGCFCQAEKSPFVGGDGKVSPCCYLGHPLDRVTAAGTVTNHGRVVFGDISEAPLDEIWLRREYVEFRARLRRGQSPLCEDCPCLFLFTRNPREEALPVA